MTCKKCKDKPALPNPKIINYSPSNQKQLEYDYLEMKAKNFSKKIEYGCTCK